MAQSFVLPRLIKEVPESPEDIMVNFKIFECAGSTVLRQLNVIFYLLLSSLKGFEMINSTFMRWNLGLCNLFVTRDNINQVPWLGC